MVAEGVEHVGMGVNCDVHDLAAYTGAGFVLDAYSFASTAQGQAARCSWSARDGLLLRDMRRRLDISCS